MRVIYLLCFALLLVAGQILFKYAALRASPDALPWSLINIWLILALGLYGIATMLWVWLMTFVPLAYAYPFAALGFVIVPLAGVYLFDEPLSWRYVVGAALIVTGIVTIATAD